jgi:hypothetical protein
MSHEDLIVTLASSVKPVRPLPSPTVRMARWVALAIVAIGAGIAIRGLRANWPAALADPTFVITNLLILVVALSAAWTTFKLSVPGALQTPVAKWLPVAGLGAWGAILVQQLAMTGSVAGALVTERVLLACMWKTYGIAVGPAFVILLLARRAAPLDWRWTGGLAALSALAFGVLGTELICPITRHAHLFTYHYLPVAVMTVVAFLLGGFVARR